MEIAAEGDAGAVGVAVRLPAFKSPRRVVGGAAMAANRKVALVLPFFADAHRSRGKEIELDNLTEKVGAEEAAKSAGNRTATIGSGRGRWRNGRRARVARSGVGHESSFHDRFEDI